MLFSILFELDSEIVYSERTVFTLWTAMANTGGLFTIIYGILNFCTSNFGGKKYFIALLGAIYLRRLNNQVD